MTIERYRDAAGELRWRLRADNGKVIADSSEGYKHERDLEHAIDLLRLSHYAEIVTVHDK